MSRSGSLGSHRPRPGGESPPHRVAGWRSPVMVGGREAEHLAVELDGSGDVTDRRGRDGVQQLRAYIFHCFSFVPHPIGGRCE